MSGKREVEDEIMSSVELAESSARLKVVVKELIRESVKLNKDVVGVVRMT
jgi:hypothetical protein